MIEIYPYIKKLQYINNEMQATSFKEDHSGEKKWFGISQAWLKIKAQSLSKCMTDQAHYSLRTITT